MSESDSLKELFELHSEDIFRFVEDGIDLPKDPSIVGAFCLLLHNYRDNKLAKEAKIVNKHFKNLIKKNRPWEHRYKDLSNCKAAARVVAASIIRRNNG